MRIGIDIRELEKGKATGIGSYLLDFLRFAAENKKEWEFVLFGNQDTRIDIEAPNFKKVYIPEHFTPWWDQIKLPHYLKREGVDVFLTPYMKVPFFAPCKFVVIINDLIPFLFPGYQDFKSIPSRMYFKTLGKRAVKRAERIVAISNHSKKDILNMFKVPKEKVEVIHLNVDESYRPVDPGASVSRYGIDGKYILYFGNFNPHKNVNTLIEAYHGLPEDIKSEYRLVLGGKKNRYCADIEETVRRLKMADRVHFTGFIPEEDLPSIYSAASLFVFPSLYEGFGLPPLEAMACGVPVICSDATSLPEVVGKAAILVNPKDVQEITNAMEKVLRDNTLRQELIDKGLERAREFRGEKAASKLFELIGSNTVGRH
ncbi:glycosyltransferase family 4 protein [Candidatus Omnitrophota bacterium]